MTATPMRVPAQQDAPADETIHLAPAAIRRDGGTQARVGNTEEVVEEYAAAMRDGHWHWHNGNRLIVFAESGAFWLADGFHRVEAAQRAALLTVPCEVRAGTRRDAVLCAVGANAQHGLRRNRQDIRRAIELLLRDEDWVKWSDIEISRRVGCSNSTVRTVRAERESTLQIARLTERMGADGKTRAMPAAPVRAELESTLQIARLTERMNTGDTVPPAAEPAPLPPPAHAPAPAACSHCGDSLVFLDNYCMSCHSLLEAQKDPSDSARLRVKLHLAVLGTPHMPEVRRRTLLLEIRSVAEANQIDVESLAADEPIVAPPFAALDAAESALADELRIASPRLLRLLGTLLDSPAPLMGEELLAALTARLPQYDQAALVWALGDPGGHPGAKEEPAA